MQKDMENSNQSYSENKKSFGDIKNSAFGTAKAAFSDLSNENIKQLTSQLVDELGEFLQTKKEDVVGMRNKCKNQIKENPFTAVIGTLVLGAIIGMIIRR